MILESRDQPFFGTTDSNQDTVFQSPLHLAELIPVSLTKSIWMEREFVLENVISLVREGRAVESRALLGAALYTPLRPSWLPAEGCCPLVSKRALLLPLPSGRLRVFWGDLRRDEPYSQGMSASLYRPIMFHPRPGPSTAPCLLFPGWSGDMGGSAAPQEMSSALWKDQQMHLG